MGANCLMYWRYLLLFLLPVLIYGCKSDEEQQQCLKDYINEVKGTPEYISIRNAAKDTVSNWIGKDLKFFGHLDTDVEWKIDSAVFFNEDKRKGLLLLLEIDKKRGVVFDYVKMLAAEYKEGSWYIYSQGFPTIGFDRSLNPTTITSRQYTFNELSKISREELINGGYFDWKSCSINYDYVNDWFKEPLAEYHQEFLNRKSEN